MTMSWSAYYLDGRTATRHAVTVHPTPSALHLLFADGKTAEWPYQLIRQTQGVYCGEPLRLEFGEDPAEALIFDEPAPLLHLNRLAPALTTHLHHPAHRKACMGWTIAAAFGLLVAVVGLYRWGIPGLAAAATPFVPVSWEERIGREAATHLAPPALQCRDPHRLRHLDSIVQQLTASQPPSPYRIHLVIVDSPLVNALAAPGGHILLFRGLLERTESPEQLAAVLAHELQHIYQRHTTRTILEQAAMGLLLSALIGNLSSGLGVGMEGAHTLAALHYSRVHEAEADRNGFRLLEAAHLDPAAMIALYRTLQQDEAQRDDDIAFLSSHPDMSRRVAALTALAAPPQMPVTRLLPGADWHDIRTLCRLHSADPSTAEGLQGP
ncbi:MAG: putative peptidase [Nitrospira sp. OLB3]|nr:MAG: putative peptidase [Nitrospira sp. OLB3]RIK59385.1 MAG: hypothetical protein DCC63_07660 [Nitrospira sp.]